MSTRPSPPKRVILLSRGLARYRQTFVEHFAAALPANVEVVACPVWGPLWEVDFEMLKRTPGRVRYCDLPVSGSLVAETSPDVVGIMEYPRPMLRELFAARRRGLPVVVFTELGMGEPRQPGVKLTTRLLHRFFAGLTQGQVALSPSARVPFGASWRPLEFAPHSIDTTEFTPRDWNSSPSARSSKCVLLCVAQYLPRKGQDLLAQALARAKAEANIDFELRLIGIHDPAWLEGVLSEAGIREHCTILGIKQGPELLAEYRNADVFVLPSRFDTYGVVTQEAAACGLPLIISKFAGSSFNLVEEGRNGFVIDPYDAAGFSAALVRILQKRDDWPSMGAHSRMLAERFCVRRIGREVAQWMQPWLA